MSRVRPGGLVLLLVALPMTSRAQISGGLSAGGAWTDNAELTPTDPAVEPVPDMVTVIKPSLGMNLELEGLISSLEYRGTASKFQAHPENDSFFHYLRARAAMVWFDRLDLQVTEELDAVPEDRGRPIESPANLVQRVASIGTISLRPDLAAEFQPGLTFRAERNDYFASDVKSPGWIGYGPEVTLRIQPGAFAIFAVGRLSDRRYDGSTESIRMTEAIAGATVEPWGAFKVEARGGMTQAEIKGLDPISAWTAELAVSRTGEAVSLSLRGRRGLAYDLDGTTAISEGGVGRIELTPPASWGLWLEGESGTMTFSDETNADRDRVYQVGRVGLRFFFSEVFVDVAASHFQSDLAGEKFSSNWASIDVGVRFQ